MKRILSVIFILLIAMTVSAYSESATSTLQEMYAQAELSMATGDYSGAAALIIGSEGSGVSRLLKEKSDVIVSLPMCGKVNSLNASVAAGILLYEITRQRRGIKAK